MRKRCRQANIQKGRSCKLRPARETLREEALEDGRQTWEKQNTVWDEILNMMKNYQKSNCPLCKKERLRFAGIVPAENFVPG